MASDKLVAKVSNLCHGCVHFHKDINLNMKEIPNETRETQVLLAREFHRENEIVDNTGYYKLHVFGNHAIKIVQDNLGTKVIYLPTSDTCSYLVYMLKSETRLGINKILDPNNIVISEKILDDSTFEYTVRVSFSEAGEINTININTPEFEVVESTIYTDIQDDFSHLFGGSGYRIKVNLTGEFSFEDQEIVNDVVNKWKSIIYGPLIPYLQNEMECNISFQTLDENILGQARPTSYITINDKYLPVAGEVTLNTINWNRQKAQSKKDGKTNAYYTLLHEFGHVLGIGTMWKHPTTGQPLGHLLDVNVKNTVDYYGTPYDVYTKYIGQHALAKYRLNLSDVTLSAIPIEDDGGLGTAGGHLEEGTETTGGVRYYDGHVHPGLDRELMTGISESDNEPEIMSTITAGFLHDIGFIVKYSSCDDTWFPEWVSYNNDLGGILNPEETINVNIRAYNLDNRFYLRNIYGSHYKNIALDINYGSGLSNCVLSVGDNTMIILQGYTIEYSVTSNIQPLIVDIGDYVLEDINDSYDINLSDLQNKELARTMILHLKPIKFAEPVQV